MKPQGIDFPGLLRKINFIMSRVYSVFVQNSQQQVLLINNTGFPSVYGEQVKASTSLDEAFDLTGVDEQECIGAVAEAGIPDGQPCRIATEGIVDVLLKNGTAATHGYWAKTSSVAGRADITLAAPPLGGVAQLDEHMQEIGHGIQSVTGGTDKLARILMHKN